MNRMVGRASRSPGWRRSPRGAARSTPVAEGVPLSARPRTGADVRIGCRCSRCRRRRARSRRDGRVGVHPDAAARCRGRDQTTAATRCRGAARAAARAGRGALDAPNTCWCSAIGRAARMPRTQTSTACSAWSGARAPGGAPTRSSKAARDGRWPTSGSGALVARARKVIEDALARASEVGGTEMARVW